TKVVHREVAGHSDVFYISNVGKARIQLAIKSDDLLRSLVARAGWSDIESDNAVAANSGRPAFQQNEILDQKTRADQQRQGNADFANHQPAAKSPARAAAGSCVTVSNGC